jgi:hypothetical protein
VVADASKREEKRARVSIPYVPLDERGWRLAMGLRPLDLANWLEVDDRREEELSLKTRLLLEQPDVVVATRREGDEASAELLDEVIQFLRTHHPEVSSDVSGEEHAVVAASRLIQEDLCVLVRDDSWRLAAACVCFPSRWNLASKIGTTLDDIHGPVPLYDEELARPTNSFFDRLKPDRSFWRLNWTLLDNADLYQPTSPRRSTQGGRDDWFFRVERQTLRQLPRTKAVVFTIRTYVASLGAMIDDHAEFGAHLVRAIDEAPATMQEYKGWHGVAQQLREVITAG